MIYEQTLKVKWGHSYWNQLYVNYYWAIGYSYRLDLKTANAC